MLTTVELVLKYSVAKAPLSTPGQRCKALSQASKMHIILRNISDRSLFLSVIISSFMLLPVSAASAENVRFRCGNAEFQLDTSRSTMTNGSLSAEPVQWQYDGEWLRWTVTRSNAAFGVNVQNGYFISGGQSADAGCRMEDPALLANLPLSEGAELRRVFVSLDLGARRSVQDYLRSLGLYNSTIDGLWGRGTQSALLAYAASLPQEYFTEGDYRSEVGARIVFNEINTLITGGDVDTPTNSAVSTSPAQQPTAFSTASAEALSSTRTASFRQNCLSTIDAISRSILRMQFSDAATIDGIWQSIGIDSRRINPSMNGSNLRRLIDPREYIPSSSVANRICLDYQHAYDRYVGRMVVAETRQSTIRYFVYETDAIERESIPGTWALRGADLGQQFSESLGTLFVTYRHETPRGGLSGPTRTESARCSVSFQILPESAQMERVGGANAPWSRSVEVFQNAFWGLPLVTVRQLSSPHERIVLTYLGAYGSGSHELIRMIDQSFSAFSGGLDWEQLEQLIAGMGSSGRSSLAPISIEDAPRRESNPFVQSAECVAELNEVREEYARATR